MESIQDIYNETVSHRISEEQLELAALIITGVTKVKHSPDSNHKRVSMLDIINELPGRRIFKTSAEVDAYLREERDSWDR